MPENNIKINLGVNELQDTKSGLGKALLAELVGNLLLNFFGCLSCVSLLDQPAGTPPNIVLIAFTFGLVIFTAVQVSGYIQFLPYVGRSCRLQLLVENVIQINNYTIHFRP